MRKFERSPVSAEMATGSPNPSRVASASTSPTPARTAEAVVRSMHCGGCACFILNVGMQVAVAGASVAVPQRHNL